MLFSILKSLSINVQLDFEFNNTWFVHFVSACLFVYLVIYRLFDLIWFVCLFVYWLSWCWCENIEKMWHTFFNFAFSIFLRTRNKSSVSFGYNIRLCFGILNFLLFVNKVWIYKTVTWEWVHFIISYVKFSRWWWVNVPKVCHKTWSRSFVVKQLLQRRCLWRQWMLVHAFWKPLKRRYPKLDQTVRKEHRETFGVLQMG